MARIVLLGLIAVAAVGAVELGRWLVRRGWGHFALLGLVPVAVWVLELLQPGSQWGLGALVEQPVGWALEGAILGLFVLPVLIGYALGLIWGFVGRRREAKDD